MPKRKYTTLHDDGSIERERRHRAADLDSQRRSAREIEHELGDRSGSPSPDGGEQE